MSQSLLPSGRVSGRQLAELLGGWREHGARHASADLAAGIQLLARDGGLPIGTRLPAEREIANHLAVSRTVISAALDLLRADGAVASRRGSGTWITLRGSTHPADTASPPEFVDLARASPEAVPELAAAARTAGARLAEHLGGHGYHERGLPLLRDKIAQRYAERGLPTTPDQIVITNGGHHAFVLVQRMLTGPGDRILVDQPTYPNALDAIRASNTMPIGVRLRPDGWDHEEIEAALRQSAPKLAYLVVDFHNPTGLRLDDEGRDRLAAALRRTRTPAVIDETLVELDLGGDPAGSPAPMAGFAEDLVITVGSASKSHWGGLRLGWIRATPELADRIVASRSSMDLGAPVFEQLVLAELLTGAEPILVQRRAELARRRDIALAALTEKCPQWSFRRPGGGLSIWCELDQPVSTRLAIAGQTHGLRIVPGSRFGVHGGLERWLRVPFGLPPNELRAAITRLARLAASMRTPGGEVDGGQPPIA
ncbi:MAG TPA: PLP-dependent aminotransferase family protein [Pseudonocardiaceae bacterium]|jgi:DNA-binding transcriptional MocR family regulator|nr:PLP-dependent aminotransferase family protein [Pseudonocardiaceae bacterium]